MQPVSLMMVKLIFAHSISHALHATERPSTSMGAGPGYVKCGSQPVLRR